jgi:RNA polymerase sigma factor (sigma-70 family)
MRKWFGLYHPMFSTQPFAMVSLHGDFSGEVAHDETEAADFAALVPPHTPIMLRVAAAIVGSVDAEDAAQEAVIRAWRFWPSLRDKQAVRSWLLSITVNVCHQWQRGEFGRRRHLTQALPDDSDTQMATFAHDPGANAYAAALDLRHAINQLERDLRLVVILRYYCELDATETGRILGIPTGTVRSRLHRALERLRERLNEASDQNSTPTQGGGSHV